MIKQPSMGKVIKLGKWNWLRHTLRIDLDRIDFASRQIPEKEKLISLSR